MCAELEAQAKKLAQQKSLLFHHEIKMKREAKIRSKIWRKLRSQKREKSDAKLEEELAAADPEYAKELQVCSSDNIA